MAFTRQHLACQPGSSAARMGACSSALAGSMAALVFVCAMLLGMGVHDRWLDKA